MSTLGIIAGGGELPSAIADCALESGRPVFVAALEGAADSSVERFAHGWTSLGQTKSTLDLLHAHDCEEIVLAGKLPRPKWRDLKLDAHTAIRLPKILSAAARGDDALLRSIVDLVEEAGFRVVSVAEAAPGLLASAGMLGRAKPSAQDQADVTLGAQVVRALGSLDVGQAAAVCNGLVLAVEAAEGTDAMLSRISSLPESLRGSASAKRGVLVKMRKPTQDGRTDLPVIGRQTVRNAAAAGLAGIGVEAGAALILNKATVASDADHAGLFVLGFSPP